MLTVKAPALTIILQFYPLSGKCMESTAQFENRTYKNSKASTSTYLYTRSLDHETTKSKKHFKK